MGSVAKDKEMKPTLNAQFSPEPTLGVRRFVLRTVGVVLGATFMFAGLAKILDLDHLVTDLQHLRLVDAFADLRHLSLANPAEFATDIDNYKIGPWPISVALAFYLPWLEIFCGFALVVRLLYRGALSILTMLILVFTLATVAAKVRGLDITCGCFGHASQHWSFPAHLLTNLAILAVLLALFLQSATRRKVAH
jgi:putative oxidoreductase